MVIELNSENFRDFISGDKPALVDFWADWCAPCKAMAPMVDLLSDFRTDINVGKVNAGDYMELAEEYGVQSIPSILMFRDGEVVDRKVGFTTYPALEAFVDSALGK